MNAEIINDLKVLVYLILGTVSIALLMGWALKQFGTMPINSQLSKQRPNFQSAFHANNVDVGISGRGLRIRGASARQYKNSDGAILWRRARTRSGCRFVK